MWKLQSLFCPYKDFVKASSAMPLHLLWTKAHMFRHPVRGCIPFSTAQPSIAAIGIDFGCKNSRVAIIDSLVPRVVDSEIGRFTPSYVTLARMKFHDCYSWALQHSDCVDECVAVGELAKLEMLRKPSDVVFNIKKMIGRQYGDCYVQEMRKRVHFNIIEGPKGEAWVEIYGMQLSPVEITSAIFGKLKNDVLTDQFHEKLKVVISVPSFYSEQQRADIMLAGQRAGLEVLQLIDEPIAAALSSSTTREGKVVVFSMGAGSYSVSILDVSDTNVKIKSQFADPSVGGDQFDNILVDYLVTEVAKLHSVDISGDKYAMTRLVEAVEQAKVELSSRSSVTVSVPYLTSTAEGPVDLRISISRAKFEKLVHNLLEEIQDNCQSILKDANISEKDIQEIVLIGGMTRVPKIQSIIYEIFGKHHSTRVNPNEAVVIGAAIQSALIVEDQQKISQDMLPVSIGIETEKGVFIRVIPRHTTVPTKQTVRIPAWCAYGECLRIKIFLGEHVMVHHNKFLGEVELINNWSSHQGFIDFEWTFEVDKDYVVKVACRNGDDEYEVDNVRQSFKAFPAHEILCKHDAYKDVRNALLDWPMYAIGVHAHVRNQARYTINILDDVLSARKDDLPSKLREDAEKALADLRMALDGDVNVLGRKILSAKSLESTILRWEPSESSCSDSSDSEN